MLDLDGSRVLATDASGTPTAWAYELPDGEWRARSPRDAALSGCSFASSLPDLSDPATLGALLALVREAWGEPVSLCQAADDDGGIETWVAVGLRDFSGRDEAESLIAALEAAPRRTT
jgi:hypothetical protein